MSILKSLFRRNGGVRDQSEKEQEREVLRNPIFGRTSFLESCDSFPNSTGDFGSETNPIPVNGPEGEIIYLNRLRSPAGVGFMYHRIGSVTRFISPYPLDVFELVDLNASCWQILYFSLYHRRRSRLAPSSLELMPWPSDNLTQVMVRLDAFGTTGFVRDFPFGLPAAVESNSSTSHLSLGMPKTFARKIQEMLDRRPGQWERPSDLMLPNVDARTEFR